MTEGDTSVNSELLLATWEVFKDPEHASDYEALRAALRFAFRARGEDHA